MAANDAMGKGWAGPVAAVDGATTVVVDAGGATVDPTGGELSLSLGIEVHAGSATTGATTMTHPDLMITSPTLLVSIHRQRMCRDQPGWNSIDSMIGAVSAMTSSKRSSVATTVMASVLTGIPAGRSMR